MIKVGDRVQAILDITEGGTGFRPDMEAKFPDKSFVHALKGVMGEVVYVDDDGAPSVRWSLRETVTVVSPCEYRVVTQDQPTEPTDEEVESVRTRLAAALRVPASLLSKDMISSVISVLADTAERPEEQIQPEDILAFEKITGPDIFFARGKFKDTYVTYLVSTIVVDGVKATEPVGILLNNEFLNTYHDHITNPRGKKTTKVEVK